MLRGIRKVNEANVPKAVEALMDIAEQYQGSKPIVDEKGHRTRPQTAEARASLKALVKHLTAARKALSALPLNTLAELSHNYDASYPQVKADLQKICQASIATETTFANQPDKSVDHARNVLAIQVAVVFRDILKVKPSSSSDKANNITNRRDGAAFARVLRETLAASGVPQVDIGPLITAGIEGLNDPELPYNIRQQDFVPQPVNC
jgi:hypothetical protein